MALLKFLRSLLRVASYDLKQAKKQVEALLCKEKVGRTQSVAYKKAVSSESLVCLKDSTLSCCGTCRLGSPLGHNWGERTKNKMEKEYGGRRTTQVCCREKKDETGKHERKL